MTTRDFDESLDDMRERAAWLIETTHLLTSQANKLQAELEIARVEISTLARLAMTLREAAG